jgi:high-affinity nickel-transport protein
LSGKGRRVNAKELTRVVVLYSLIGIITAFGLTASLLISQSSVLLAGLAITSYVLGLRHGFDADHIAAIDNTTRKLIQEGKKPLTIGTWFSLGHSTIVIGLIIALVLSTRAVIGSVTGLQNVGSILGTMVSGIFLWFIGILNAVIAIEIYRIFSELRRGKLKQSGVEELLNKRGFMNRYFGSMFKVVSKSWQIYPVGLLFGIGFDTATEVALIAISVGVGVTTSIPIWMVLVLPLMFTCGMVLVDTSDGVVMRFAYSWAFLRPIRKIYYNLTITIISIVVAFLIGTIELLQVLSAELKLTGGFWEWLSNLDFETVGIGIVIIFAFSWLVSIAYYRYKRLDETGLGSPPSKIG